MMTLAEILDMIKENYAIIGDTIERINNKELLDMYVPHSPYGMYYSDADILTYFVNETVKLQDVITSGEYAEENYYVD